MGGPLNEVFLGPSLDPRLGWHCEPAQWRIGHPGGGLIVEPDAGTDFWQKTHYGFEADNGHFLRAEVRGDFVLTTKVVVWPIHQYDQAGLMVRLTARCWLKTSVEFEVEGPNRLGAVVTNGGYSDWSTQSVPRELRVVWFRVASRGADFLVESSADGREWQQIRLARLQDWREGEVVESGLYACSPRGGGFRAEFEFLELVPRVET